MKIQHRSKLVRTLTPECKKRLLNWPDQKAQVLDVLRQLPQTEEFFGPWRRVDTKVRIPETWTEIRESLRNLTPKRNYGIGLIYRGKCRRCGERFNATSHRKHYCSNECQKKTEYQTRLEKGDFKKGMARTRQRKRQAAYDREVKRIQIRGIKQKMEAESHYRDVVFGKFDKSYPSRYSELCNRLGNGDEIRGHNKITGWYRGKIKFAQIPVVDQNIFHNLDSEIVTKDNKVITGTSL